MLTRRSTLIGLLFAPAIIKTPGLLMEIKPQKPSFYTLEQYAKDILVPISKQLMFINIAYNELMQESFYKDKNFFGPLQIKHPSTLKG